MRALVGCEFSGRVRQAFRDLGHDTYSCDLLPAEDGSPYHFQCDVLTILDQNWDLAIFHPDCTYLTNSGVRWLHSDPSRWARLDAAAEFFLKLWNAPIGLIAIENPIMHRYARDLIGMRQSQVTQPWMWGDFETKATCLWLKGLPLLSPTYKTSEECRIALGLPEGTKPTPRVHHASPGPDRWKERSRTMLGFAAALAMQYGGPVGL